MWLSCYNNGVREKDLSFPMEDDTRVNEKLLQPLDYYEKIGKKEHEDNVTAHFDELLAKSKVDVAQNRTTVKAYKAEMVTVGKIRDKIARKKALRVLLVLAVIAGVVCGIFGIYKWVKQAVGLGAGLLFGGAGAAILCLVLLVKVVNPAIRQANERLEKHLQKAEALRKQAEAQMAPLNALFDNTDTFRLLQKTIPDFEFDDNFSTSNERLLLQNYDFEQQWDGNRSTVDTVSGRFAGNPFLYADHLVARMGTETYHGTLVISWTVTVRDGQGNTRTERRTQTLHASVIKPKPYYFYHKQLYYGCQAAPDLSFSREPKHSERLTEKERQRKIHKGAKRLKKKSEKAIKNGGRFQEMANAEFDVLFGAEDRNHEVQFRLLYTPLAQRNTVDLLTSKTGYGDDFHWRKARRLNILSSEHAQNWGMDTSPIHYYSYDVDEARRNFIQFNNDYFKSLYFDFAPFFSVPAYLEAPSASLETMEEYDSRYTAYEHEAMANAIGAKIFAHSRTATDVILKTDFLGKAEDADRVAVTAYSYAAENRVDFIPVYGGDGRMHAVPVPWVEYIPLQNVREMTVGEAPFSMLECNKLRSEGSYESAIFFHGMAGRII